MSKATSPAKSSSKPVLKNVTHHVICKHDEHALNQIATRALKNGDLVAVFNEERFPYHHDSGQTLFIALARRRQDLGPEVPQGGLALDLDHGQLGLRHLRARRRHLADQHDHHRLLQARHQAGAALLEQPSPDQGMGRLDLGLQDARLARHLRHPLHRRRRELERSGAGERPPAEAWRLPARLLAAAERLAAHGPLWAHPRL